MKFLIMLLLLAMPVMFSGCSPDDNNADGMTVGIIQMMDHPALNLVRESFVEEMHRLGYTDVNIDHRVGIGADMATLTDIANLFIGNNVDVIVTIATPATHAAANQTSTIPIVFSAITDPVGAGFVPSFESPDRNLTGVSDALPVDAVFDFAAVLVPEATTFGLIYNLGESNSVSLINQAKEIITQRGLSYAEITVVNTGEVQQAALSLVGRVDAIFVPTDNTVAAAMPVLADVAINAGIPVFTGADSMVFDGGLATVGVDYAIVGKMTAAQVSQILAGTPIYQVPTVGLTEFSTIVNRATAEALGIDINDLPDYVEIFEGN
ncbi:MAG: ABC transporter substrate-binding protein [Defluviitaleaceae bacterium]|nr:ABC transporter substrate-binding protein [Defluviitaleaceae bacterium]